MLATLLLLAAARAEEPLEEVAGDDRELVFRDQPIDRHRFVDLGAYTLPHREVQVGLTSVKVGLLDNLQVSLAPPLWLIGVFGADAKVDAIQTDLVHASLHAGIHRTSFDLGGGYRAEVTVTPVQAMTSWDLHEQLQLHGGLGWLTAEVDGEFPIQDLAEDVSGILGVDLAGPIEAVTDEDNALYGGARMTLSQLRLALDFQLNGRDAIVLQSNTWLALRGRLDAGYAFSYDEADVTVGAAAEVGPIALTDLVATTTTLSWQWTWRYVHLRLGIPLPSFGTGQANLPAAGWVQANELWVQWGSGR